LSEKGIHSCQSWSRQSLRGTPRNPEVRAWGRATRRNRKKWEANHNPMGRGERCAKYVRKISERGGEGDPV